MLTSVLHKNTHVFVCFIFYHVFLEVLVHIYLKLMGAWDTLGHLSPRPSGCPPYNKFLVMPLHTAISHTNIHQKVLEWLSHCRILLRM